MTDPILAGRRPTHKAPAVSVASACDFWKCQGCRAYTSAGSAAARACQTCGEPKPGDAEAQRIAPDSWLTPTIEARRTPQTARTTRLAVGAWTDLQSGNWTRATRRAGRANPENQWRVLRLDMAKIKAEREAAELRARAEEAREDSQPVQYEERIEAARDEVRAWIAKRRVY